MTLEEAGEIVLSQRKLTLCTECQGAGCVVRRVSYGKRHTDVRGRRGFEIPPPKGTQTCLQCDGWGLTTREDYIQACELLGKDIMVVRISRPSSSGANMVSFDEDAQQWVFT